MEKKALITFVLDNMETKKKSRKRKILAVIAASFIVGFFGSYLLPTLHAKAASAVKSDRRWPRLSKWTHSLRLPTLVLFLDPSCEPSVNTVRALMKLQGDQQTVFDVIVFLTPSTAKTVRWSKSVTAIAALRRIQLALDESGEEASLFGAFESGQAAIYSASGELLKTGVLLTNSNGVDLVPSGNSSATCKLFENPRGAQ